MATKKSSGAKQTSVTFRPRAKRRRPGRHSKKRTSRLKSSRNWHKPSRGQGS